jgi:2',3'-cyclic-nucleotide 2'-phosphodiesterase (5'-nucleotidase family)
MRKNARVTRPSTMLLAALAACALASPAGARTHRLTVLAASDLDGRLAAPECRDEPASAPTLARLAAALARARAEAERDERRVVASVHLGDLSGPAALGRFVMGRDGGVERFVGLVARAGFTHLLLGNNFLDHEPKVVAAYAPALERAGITVLNANVTCTGRDDCEALERMPATARLEVEGLQVELVGATLEATFGAIDPAARQGLAVKPFATTVGGLAEAGRAAGSELVVAATHATRSRNDLASTVLLARQLGAVDVLLANHLGEATESVATVQPGDGPALAASGEQADGVMRLDLDVEEAGGRATVLRMTAVRVPALVPEPGLQAELRALVGEYCAAWSEPLAPVEESVVDGRGFLSFVLDRMREEGAAEVAAVNEGLADLGPFPLVAPLSRADVYEALPYDDHVVRADVTGARLRALWQRAGPRSALPQRLIFEGIAERDGGLWVNERPLVDGEKYTIALPDYVARGGDDLVGEPIQFKPVEREGAPLRVRESTLRSLAAPELASRLVTGLGLDLAARPRFSWSGGLTLSAQDTRLVNKLEYPDEARLGKAEASTLRGEATGRLDMDARDHAFRLTGRGVYARTSVSGAESKETEDQLFSEALYRHRAMRRQLEEAWWAPVPYLSARLDSELVRNAPPAFQHFELGATVGVRLLPVRPLEVKAGAGVRREMFDPAGRPRFGLELGYELPRFSPLKLSGLPIDVESNLDYFVSDPGGEARQEGRLRARLLLPLGGPIAVTAGFDVFVLKRGAQPFAVASDATVGITARFDGAAQAF